MWSKIVNKIRGIESYKSEIKRLKERVNELVDTYGDPKFVVEKILQTDLDWYDWEGMKTDDKKAYYLEAQAVLKNRILKNEVNHICSDIIKHIATKSNDFQEVRDLRMTISGVKLLVERLEGIGADKEPTKEDLYKGI